MLASAPVRFLCVPFLCLMFSLASWDGQAKSALDTEKSVVVKESRANLRDAGGTHGKILDTLTEFTPVQKMGQEGEYVKVKTTSGKVGYVHGSLLARSNFLSVKGSYANMRSGPNRNDPVLWKIKRNWPLQALEKSGSRVKVRDYEGSEGWVHESLLSTEPYVVVKLKWINLREGPGLDANGKPKYAKRFTAEQGVVFKVLEEREGWLRVRHADGDEGWCSGNIVWGYFPE